MESANTIPEISDSASIGGNSQMNAQAAGVSISLYPGYVEMPVNTSLKLVYTVSPESAKTRTVEWNFTDSGVAAVSQDGTITSAAEGDAVIEAGIKGVPGVKAYCHVHVTGKGPVYLFTRRPENPPDDPADDASGGQTDGQSGGRTGDQPVSPDDKPQDDQGKPDADGQAQDADENISVEYDGTIPVEVIPTLDEFVWIIKIDDTQTDYDVIPGRAVAYTYKYKFTAVKNGGKMPFGDYSGSASETIEADVKELERIVSEEGGEPVKIQLSYNVDIKYDTIKLTRYDHTRFNPDDSDPVKKHISNLAYMAMGSGEMEFSGGANMTITAHGGGGSGSASGAKKNPYMIRVAKSGAVRITYNMAMVSVGGFKDVFIVQSGKYKVIGNTIIYYDIIESVYEGTPFQEKYKNKHRDGPEYDFIDNYNAEEDKIEIDMFWLHRSEQ